MAVVISDRRLDGGGRLLKADTDEHLVRLVQSGDEAAFAAIVRRYEAELQSQARRLTSDGRGEDAVQQAFLNAFAALHNGADVQHLRGWLHQILRHAVIRGRVPVDASLEDIAICGEPLEETVQRRATARAALTELRALPDRQRDALLRTAVLGHPRAQVARTMGLSEGAVRQLVHRARLRVRQAATAFVPFPLLRFFGVARSGVDCAPDAAIGAGTAASGGLVLKVGALLASGALATGIAVTHPLPTPHRAPPRSAGAADHGRQTHARLGVHTAPVSGAAVAVPAVVALTRTPKAGAATPQAVRGRLRSEDGRGRLGRDGSGSSRGRGGGGGSDSSRGSGNGEHGSGSTRVGAGTSSGTSGEDHGQAGSGSQRGGDGGSGAGRGGSPSTSGTSGRGSSGDGGSSSGAAAPSSGGGRGSGQSGPDAGDDAATTTATDDDASTTSGSSPGGSSDMGHGGSAGATGGDRAPDSDGSSSENSSSDGGSGKSSSVGSRAGQQDSGGSRDLSGSLVSSSS